MEARSNAGGVLSSRQLLFVDILLALALAILMNRDLLPKQLLPEYRLAGSRVRVVYGTLSGIHAPETVSLRGRPMLLVGDSMILNFPVAHDQICVLGGTTTGALAAFHDLIEDRHYEQIVLWTGTCHLVSPHVDPETFLPAIRELVAEAQQHADQVVIVGPMPFPRTLPELQIANSVDLVRAAMPELRAISPDVPVFDTERFFEELAREPDTQTYFRDHIHLSQKGFERLIAEMAANGIVLHETRQS